MSKLDLSLKNLRKFGIIMFVAFLVIALFIILRHKQNFIIIFGISATFLVFTIFIPGILKPIYIVWMRLAVVLSWINTRLILLLVFYLVITPIGLLMRLFGADPLEIKMDKNKITYWHSKEKQGNNLADYERRF